MRAPGMIRLALFVLGVLVVAPGCIKRPEPAKATAPIAVAAVFLLDQESDVEVLAAPQRLIDASVALLGERDLLVRPVPNGEWSADFARRRSTRQRMQTLLDATEEDVVLLVETRARMASLMEGRYSWTVPVQLTLARRGRTDFPVQASIEAPAFLRFAHHGPADAVEAVVPVITRRLGRMVDELLSDEATTTVGGAPPAPAKDRTTQVRVGSDAIYFAMVDRFRNGDPSNDGDVDESDPQAFHGGDLRGVIDDLDRLASLGFRTVWLSPVWDTRDDRVGPWGAFHGYWVEDPGLVEPRFGTDADLLELRDGLAQRGMGLVLDFVANHVAPGSPLVTEHPDWFHSEGDIEDWGNAAEAISHDVHGLPDLAQENPDVARWLVGHASSWQERIRPEGFRLDAVRHVAPEFWRELNGVLREADQDVVLIGELFDGSPRAIAESWRTGGFTGMFDFPLHYALTDVFCGSAGVGKLASTLAQDRVHPDARSLVTFLDNHDLPRIASRCARDEMASAFSILLALRGRPSVTWGTELPLDGAEEPENRSDFDWAAERSFEKQIALGLKVRADWTALRATEREVVVLDDNLFAWIQGDETSAALIAVSRDSRPRSVDLPPLGSWQDPSLGAELSDALEVPAKGVAIATTRGEGTVLSEWLGQARIMESVSWTVRLAGASAGAGDSILLVGAGEQLGEWDPARGVIALREGEDFVATVSVPMGDVLEYKFVVRREGGDLLWEQRENRYELVRGADTVSTRWES